MPLILLAIFDPNGDIRPETQSLISAYIQLSKTLVVIDTTINPSLARIQFFKTAGVIYHNRANIGYDFTSYKVGLDLYKKEIQARLFSSIIIANDSCFGPFSSLNVAIDKTKAHSGKTVWGMTDSFEPHYHIQSYWLLAYPEAFGAFVSFFETLPPIRSRREAIYLGELKLTPFLKSQGVEIHTLAPYFEVYSFSNIPSIKPNVNPTTVFWGELIQKFEIPFIKKSTIKLLAKDPESYQKMKSILQKKSPKIWEQVESAF